MCRSRCMHIDTGKKFPEMYAFRDRYVARVGAEAHPRGVPAGRGDGPDAAARRALGGAQDPGPARRHRQARLHRHHRRHPARRGGDPRQGARVQPARRRRAVGFPRPAAGILGPVQHRPAARARICASIRCCIGPSSTSGATSEREGYPGDRSLFRQERQALSLARRQGHHLSRFDSNAATVDEIIAELESDQHAGACRPRHGPRDRGCLRAPARRRDTCDARSAGPKPDPRSAAADTPAISCASSSSAMSITASRRWSAACSTTPARCPKASSRPSRRCASAAACRSNGPS